MNRAALLAYVGRSCPRVEDFLADRTELERQTLLSEIIDTPNPRSTTGRIDDLLAGNGSNQVRTVLLNPDLRGPFLATVAGSGFLYSIVRRAPELVESLFVNGGYLVRKTRRMKQEELTHRIEAAADQSLFNKILRLYKEEEYLRIGCRDLGGLGDVKEVMEELSDLAAASVQAAMDFHWGGLMARYGRPFRSGDGKGFVALGMGKIGGRELNFSSDVDLIFLRGPEEGLTEGPEAISVREFYEHLARAVTQSLSEMTEDGFVFRIDLRLRPEGEKGELVPSVTNALNYYLEWGRTWERAALIKAVPVAGDLGLGKAFMEALEPFIFRRHLDYSTLEEMREMKLRVEAKLKRKPGVNIKLGQGGIRAIEFFVQTLQLINGGRNPRVRSSSTLKALDLFRKTGLLDKETTSGLREAYTFFREIEHRIQINHQLQTHQLPTTAEDQEELARRMGYRTIALERFLSDLEKRRRFVDDIFSSLLYSGGEEILEQCSSQARMIVDTIRSEDTVLKLLADLGFEEPATSYPLLKELISPSDTRRYSERGKRLLERLAPLLVDELLRLPEPGTALMALDRYIRAMYARSIYFSTLLENPPTARFLVRILGESRFFTELLVRHPHAIDSLIGRWAVPHADQKESLESELSEKLTYCDEYEDELDVLRIFKNEQILRIGVSHLTGELTSPTARRLITELAEVCLSASVRIAVQEMARKFGRFDFLDPLPFVILGMGKLGGMEMTYLSDVDVIFIYDPPQESIGPFSSHEWFTRLASRIISILSIPTAEGTVFQIDTRLRPSGQKGPLVSSLSSFREYHRATSKLWEKQALIKARPVTGPTFLRDDVTTIVRDCLLRTSISTGDIREIARLRTRMETELAMEDSRHVDLKTGHGGLVDVEFYVQANILAHAKRLPQVLHQNTLEALDALHRAGLIDDVSFGIVDDGYRFLSNLEDRLRIMEHRSVDRMPTEGEKLRGLARRLGYKEGEEDLFLDDYFNTTDSIRTIYSSLFGVGEEED